MNRRQMIFRTGAAALGLGLAGWTPHAQAGRSNTKRVLFFSKSSGFEHSVIQRKNGEPSFAENILSELGPKNGIEFTFSKDGSLFTPKYLAGFDAFFFFTTGTLTEAGTDKNPPMTPEGKAAFLDAIHNGKGFIGTHSATDTFHTEEAPGFDKSKRVGRYHNYGDAADPYAKMIGAAFIIHGAQQKARMRVVDPKFPGFEKLGDGFEAMEEWYSLNNFAPDLHVLLVQETGGMKGPPYERPPYPATWARMHGKGRVFYTSMGHREDVWTSERFQQLLFGGITWAAGSAEADVRPNVEQAAPGYLEQPPEPAPGGTPKLKVTNKGKDA